MNLMARLEVGSMVSSTAEETMRHMCTRMEGKGTHDMTYQNTARGWQGGLGRGRAGERGGGYGGVMRVGVGCGERWELRAVDYTERPCAPLAVRPRGAPLILCS
jgi:hypothetical protein